MIRNTIPAPRKDQRIGLTGGVATTAACGVRRACRRAAGGPRDAEPGSRSCRGSSHVEGFVPRRTGHRCQTRTQSTFMSAGSVLRSS